MNKRTQALLTATATALLLSTPIFAAPAYVPNSLKYSDAGIANAQGRSGSATGTARALLNRDGSTDVEVTTGNFDGAAPSGTLKHIQLKLGTDARNYNTDSSTFALHLTDRLARHSALQVQSTVYGADDHRTGVVTVDEIVKLRPDLAPGELNAPQQALLGVPVMISAVLEERNGDTGARANCVLYADGVEADRANGIWIDAGDSVVCSFEHAFATAGDKQLEVRLDSVTPADWNDANNSIAGSINIIDPATAMPEWTVNASDRAWTSWSKIIDPGYYENETTDSGFSVGLHFYGYVKQSALDYETVSVGYREVSGGTTFADSANMTFEYEGTTFYGRCKQFYEQGVRVNICTPGLPKNFPYEEGPTDLISIQASRFATDITYHSAGSQLRRDWETGEEYVYTWNNGFHQVQGLQKHYEGDSVELDVTLRDGANRVIAARPNIPLEPYEQHYDSPYVCWGSYCNGSYYHLTGRRGTQSFNW